MNIFFRKICRSIYHLVSESLEFVFVKSEAKKKYENEIIAKSEKSPKWSEKEKSLNVNEKHLLFTSERESMKMKTNGEIKWKILLKSIFIPFFTAIRVKTSSNETVWSNHARVRQKGRQKSELWKTESIISYISFVESLSLLLSSPFTLWLPS